jgi:hypothetical protein
MLTQLTYYTLLIDLTHSPILYLDTDPPIYKSVLSIPKTSDLTCYPPSYHSDTLYPLNPLYLII